MPEIPVFYNKKTLNLKITIEKRVVFNSQNYDFDGTVSIGGTEPISQVMAGKVTRVIRLHTP